MEGLCSGVYGDLVCWVGVERIGAFRRAGESAFRKGQIRCSPEVSALGIAVFGVGWWCGNSVQSRFCAVSWGRVSRLFGRGKFGTARSFRTGDCGISKVELHSFEYLLGGLILNLQIFHVK